MKRRHWISTVVGALAAKPLLTKAAAAVSGLEAAGAATVATPVNPLHGIMSYMCPCLTYDADIGRYTLSMREVAIERHPAFSHFDENGDPVMHDIENRVFDVDIHAWNDKGWERDVRE